jgi:hypothetical protein
MHDTGKMKGFKRMMPINSNCKGFHMAVIDKHGNCKWLCLDIMARDGNCKMKGLCTVVIFGDGNFKVLYMDIIARKGKCKFFNSKFQRALYQFEIIFLLSPARPSDLFLCPTRTAGKAAGL